MGVLMVEPSRLMFRTIVFNTICRHPDVEWYWAQDPVDAVEILLRKPDIRLVLIETSIAGVTGPHLSLAIRGYLPGRQFQMYLHSKEAVTLECAVTHALAGVVRKGDWVEMDRILSARHVPSGSRFVHPTHQAMH